MFLAVTNQSHRIGSDREEFLWVRLSAGRQIQLALINDTESGDPTEFRSVSLTAARLVR
jgi:hypothetical protein